MNLFLMRMFLIWIYFQYLTGEKSMIDTRRSIKACAAYYGDDADSMESYLIEGLRKHIIL